MRGTRLLMGMPITVQIIDTAPPRLLDEVFDYFVGELTVKRGMELANFQPKFLIDQIVAACNFKEMAPRFERQFIDYAISNLSVHRTKGQPMTLAKVS